MSRTRRSRGGSAGGIHEQLALWQALILSRFRALSFCLAVILPWCVLGFVVMGYFTIYPAVFGGLVAGWVLCTVASRNYKRQ